MSILELLTNGASSRVGLLGFLLVALPAAFAESPSLGGRLVLAQRSEPRTLNPVLALDEPSRALAGMLHASLVRVNALTQTTEPALAEKWTVSPDGRQITVWLRDELRFSDGQPLTADDVLFTFEVLQDEKVASALRDTLRVGGRPIAVVKLNDRTLRFDLAQAYALGERMLDGIAILPRHLLESTYREGKFATAWRIGEASQQIAGAGPFRLKQYAAGQRVVLERNPHFWKRDTAGRAMPYLSEVVVLFTTGEDAQVARFLAGEAHVIAGFGAGNYAMLASSRERSAYDLHDAGAGLDYTFLLFNLNAGKGKPWFSSANFRQAISAAIDRDAVVRLVYRGRALPIRGHVTPGRTGWIAASLPKPARSLDRAKELLRRDNFKWNDGGKLIDANGQPVQFTVIANAANASYTQTATILQEDLKQLGISVTVVPLEFRALVDRVMDRKEYDTAVMALRPGDSDPVADMNMLLSTGPTHLWNLRSGSAGYARPAAWEAEIDRLMHEQLGTRDVVKRKASFDRVQKILSEQMPIVCLASPNVLVAARKALRNLKPAVLGNPALWNIEELYWMEGHGIADANQRRQ